MDSLANPESFVKENDYVILKKANSLRLQQVLSGRDFWIDKIKCTVEGLIGHPYGTTFEVKSGKFAKMIKAVEVEIDTSDGIETEKDNRNLLDSDANQKLTMEEIEKMKKDGVSGDKLIEQLIENSATFQTKTGYAQEKWVKKKKKKHLMEFTVLKPTSRLLCEMQWAKGPSRICNLRVDSLAQILSWSNVRAHNRVAVIDTCQGLVTGAVLERLGGFGTLINLYYGEVPSHMNYALERYGFSKEILAPLHHFPLDEVNSLKYTTASASVGNGDTSSASTDTCDKKLKTENDATTSEQVPQIDLNNEAQTDVAVADKNIKENTDSLVKEVVNVEVEVETAGNGALDKKPDEEGNRHENKQSKRRGKGKQKSFEERVVAKQARAKETEAARKLLQEKNLDCLIVACKFYPTPIVLALLEYVLPSRQLVVYSQHKEALQDCYAYLREQKGVINFRLTESWLREYQVLPNRTHPVIQMSGTGGYLLTATTVDSKQT